MGRREKIKIEDIVDRLAEKGYFSMEDVVAMALGVGYEDPQLVRRYAKDVLAEKEARGVIRKVREGLYECVG